MTWIGDVDIPWITSEAWSQSRDTSEHNFTAKAPSQFELRRALEGGDISVVLHKSSQQYSDDLVTQVKSLDYLVRRNPTYNAFDFLGERGHLSVNSYTAPRTNWDNIREASLTVRYMPDATYAPGGKVNPTVYENSHSVTANGWIATGASATSVTERDSTGTLTERDTPVQTLTTETGDVDIYTATENQYIFEHPDDYSKPLRQGRVDAYEHNGSSTESNWTKLYENAYIPTDGLVVENGFIRIVFNDPANNDTHIYFYDGTNWVDAGNVNLANGQLLFGNRNSDELWFKSDNADFRIARGEPIIRAFVDNKTDITFDTSTGDNPLDSSNVPANEVYLTGDNTSISHTYMLLHLNNEGTKQVTNQTLEVTGLTSSNNYTMGFGVVPSSWTMADAAHRSITNNNWSRELIQRQVI